MQTADYAKKYGIVNLDPMGMWIYEDPQEVQHVLNMLVSRSRAQIQLFPQVASTDRAIWLQLMSLEVVRRVSLVPLFYVSANDEMATGVVQSAPRKIYYSTVEPSTPATLLHRVL